MPKRKNKSKKEVVSDIQLVQDADRRRALIRDVIFPYLVEVGEDIQYSKIFLQSVAGIVESVYEESRKQITIGDIKDKINSKIDGFFSKNSSEKERYLLLIKKIEEISVQDFAYAAELARYIDGYVIKTKGKESINTIPINEILG